MARVEKEHLEKVISHAKSLQENGENMMTFTAYDKSDLEAFQKKLKNIGEQRKLIKHLKKSTD